MASYFNVHIIDGIAYLITFLLSEWCVSCYFYKQYISCSLAAVDLHNHFTELANHSIMQLFLISIRIANNKTELKVHT